MSPAVLVSFREAPAAIVARVALEDERWETALPGHEALIRAALAALAARCALDPAPASELGVTLANDAAVRVLNARWRDKDKPTNVLSFPMRALSPGDAPGPMLGDLVLALETLEREAADERKALADHFSHLVVHGTLHCLGYDHATDAEADAMEAREILILGDLGVADPYIETEVEKEPIRA